MYYCKQLLRWLHHDKVRDLAKVIILCVSLLVHDCGRFPFNQNFRGFRVGRRMEQNFPGIKFRNFRTTSRGSPKIPENRNNRKIKGKFRSIRPFRLGPSFSEPYWRDKMASSMSSQYQCTECLFSSENLQVLVQHNCLGHLAGMAGVMSGK